MLFTMQKRVEFVKLFYKSNDCARAAPRSFSELHPGKLAHLKYFLMLMEKITETGSVQNIKYTHEWDAAGETTYTYV